MKDLNKKSSIHPSGFTIQSSVFRNFEFLLKLKDLSYFENPNTLHFNMRHTVHRT